MTEKEKQMQEEAETAVSYGGYSTRHDYEKTVMPKKGRTFAIGAAGAAILCLLVFAAFGVFALVSGDLFGSTQGAGEELGAIRVPTQSELLASDRTPSECLESVEPSMLTLEVKSSDGSSRFLSGFVVSVDGYAVCSAAGLPKGGVSLGMTAHFDGGISSDAYFVGASEKCGVALLKLTADLDYTPISAGNFDFVKRGETLLIAGAVYAKSYYGTAVSGMVASVGETLQAGRGDDAFSVPVAYLDVLTNDSLYGAPVLNESGQVVGFCTAAAQSEFGDFAAVIPINAVYTIINDILANS